MSEEEFFNAMDMDIDLSFLQPADSPQSRPADTKFPTKVSSGDINVSSRTLIEHQDERKIEPTLSHIASPHDQQLPNQQPETSVLAHTTNPTNIAAVTTVTAAAVPTKSLATWTFNKRKRKRIYVSLTGKKLTGPEAIRQCREGAFLFVNVLLSIFLSCLPSIAVFMQCVILTQISNKYH